MRNVQRGVVVAEGRESGQRAPTGALRCTSSSLMRLTVPGLSPSPLHPKTGGFRRRQREKRRQRQFQSIPGALTAQ